jgi:hypothetical protein
VYGRDDQISCRVCYLARGIKYLELPAEKTGIECKALEASGGED